MRTEFRMINMFERIKWYKKITKSRKLVPTNGQDEAAKKAELRVLQKVKKNNLTIATFHQKRIPDVNKRRGFGEVDVIAVTKKAVFAIEVKNWTGEIDIVDGNLVQTNRKPSKNNVFDHISTKADNIKFVYLSEFGEELFEVKPLIVMTNKNCKFTEAVENHPMVIKISQLNDEIKTAVNKLDDYATSTTDELIMMLDKFPTWDTISLANSQEEIGDIVENSMPFDWDRSKYSAVNVSIPRGLFATILFGPQIKIATILHDGDTVEELIKPNKETITLRRPTVASEYRELPITAIESIQFGGSEIFDWEKFSAKSNSKQHHSDKNEFEVGGVYIGRIAKDLDHSFLIVLKEKVVSGLLSKNSLDVHVDLIDQFYSIGKTVKVKILKFSNKSKTKCKLIEVNND